MLNVVVFNQNDPRWKNDQHGTSNSTIGATGCTICVICSMLVHAGYDIDPKRLNVMLTQNHGYAAGNLVIWQAIERLFPLVKFIFRYYEYRNDLASEWIKQKGIIPIVQVGAAPIGGAPNGKHWVGFVGDMKSIDPWTGRIVDTSTWEPNGMALYDYKPVTNNQGEIMPTDLQTYLGVQNDDEARAKLKEHLGEVDGKCNWGAEGEAGGFLGAERRYSKTVSLNMLAVAKLLGLEDTANIETILAKIKRLVDADNSVPGETGSTDNYLPKTYNGKEVVAVVIKP